MIQYIPSSPILARLFRKQSPRPRKSTQHLFDLLVSADTAELPRIRFADFQQQLVKLGHKLPEKVLLHPQFTGLGSGSVAEMAMLAALVAQVCPRSLLEFGTYDGASTWHLLANSPVDARVTTIDLPSNTKVQGSTDAGLQGVQERVFLPHDGRIRLIENDSRHWEPDLSSVDFAFVDAGHSYNCVKNDTEKAISVLRKGGLLVWHDATWREDEYGVNRFLRELYARDLAISLLDAGPYDYSGLAALIV